MFASPNRAAMMNAVPPSRRGVASGVGTTFLNSGSTISLGVTLVVMSSVMPRSAIDAILTGGSAAGVPVSVGAGFLQSIHLIFYISGALALLSLIPSVLRGATPRYLAEPPAPPATEPEGD